MTPFRVSMTSGMSLISIMQGKGAAYLPPTAPGGSREKYEKTSSTKPMLILRGVRDGKEENRPAFLRNFYDS